MKNALSPSQVLEVIVDEEEQATIVVVPDYQLSLAIGKRGQNARLAAKLTGWKIDIKSESDAREEGIYPVPEEDVEESDDVLLEDPEPLTEEDAPIDEVIEEGPVEEDEAIDEDSTGEALMAEDEEVEHDSTQTDDEESSSTEQ